MSSAIPKKSSLRTIRVSPRDRAIFEAVQVNCRSQRTVAIEFKLSQPRVSAIVKRVTRWLGQGVPPGLDELPRAARLRAVSRLHRQRLEHLLQEAMDAWRKSDSTTHTISEKVEKGEVVNRTTKVQTRNRDLRQLRHVAELEDRILAFEGFDERGNVDESSTGRVHEEPERTPAEACREVKRRMILGNFDTPGDEGIPGLWGAEMEKRNAEVAAKRAAGNGTRDAGVGDREIAQQSCPSLAPVLQGEGPAPRADLATDLCPRSPRKWIGDPPPQRLGGSLALPGSAVPSSAMSGAHPEELLSPKVITSAQDAEEQIVTSAEDQEIVLSKPQPRYRLMGTAAEMAVSKSYEDFFSLEEQLYRATEKAKAAALEKAKAAARAKINAAALDRQTLDRQTSNLQTSNLQTPQQPLSPSHSPEYRSEGV